MRFVSFIKDGRTAIGCLEPNEETLLDLTRAGLSDNLISVIEMGEQGLDMAREAATKSQQIPIRKVRLIAPFHTPRRNIICVGKNYFEHSKEFEKSGFDSTSGGQTIPDAPVITVNPGFVIINVFDFTDRVRTFRAHVHFVVSHCFLC